jgi:hypothetical protein
VDLDHIGGLSTVLVVIDLSKQSLDSESLARSLSTKSSGTDQSKLEWKRNLINLNPPLHLQPPVEPGAYQAGEYADTYPPILRSQSQEPRCGNQEQGKTVGTRLR